MTRLTDRAGVGGGRDVQAAPPAANAELRAGGRTPQPECRQADSLPSLWTRAGVGRDMLAVALDRSIGTHRVEVIERLGFPDALLALRSGRWLRVVGIAVAVRGQRLVFATGKC